MDIQIAFHRARFLGSSAAYPSEYLTGMYYYCTLLLLTTVDHVDEVGTLYRLW